MTFPFPSLALLLPISWKMATFTFPHQEWIARTLERSDFDVVSMKAFPVIYGAKKLLGQLGVCSQKFKATRDPALAELKAGLRRRMEKLTSEIEANVELGTGLCFGMDYIVEAKRRVHQSS